MQFDITPYGSDLILPILPPINNFIITSSNSSLSTSNMDIFGNYDIILGNNDNIYGQDDWVEGNGNTMHGNNNAAIGNNNTLIGNNCDVWGSAGIEGNGISGGGNYNILVGNSDVILGNFNNVTGDNTSAEGDGNILTDSLGGTQSVDGNANLIYDTADDVITMQGVQNALDFTKVTSGHSTVNGFSSTDAITLAAGSQHSLSSSSAGSTLDIVNSSGHFDVLFAGTAAATVAANLQVMGTPLHHVAMS